MHRSKEAIERGLELYRSLLGHHPAVEEEFARTRRWFAGGTAGPDDAERIFAGEPARRHLEWFLLEHPCEHLGGVPAAVLRDAWREAAGSPEDEFPEAFINTFAGAFEVSAADRAQGAWLRDLFGSGEYPIEEPEAAAELEEGDLVVGRLFPVGDGVFRLSPAASCFRDPELLQAVSADAVRMRSERRGVLRIEQLELERLFFGGPEAAPSPEGDPACDVRRLLAEVDVTEDHLEMLIASVESGAQRGDGRVVTEVLDELAFDSEVDLEELRNALVAFWNECAAPPGARPAGPEPPAPPDRGGSDAVRAALASFDTGRAEGGDLEALFQQLERDLDCPDSDSPASVGEGPLPDLEDGEIPDFPGAVGAMVEEFFWEREQDGETGVPAGHRSLWLLAEYGERIGVFENLSPRDLLDFAGRWVLDEDRLPNARAASDLLSALGDFCRWCDAEHAVALTEEFAPLCTELEAALPRLVEARALAPTRNAGPYAFFKVAMVEEGAVVLRDPDDVEHRIALAPDLTTRLRPGDVVHARIDGGDARLGALYPAVIERLLKR